jgi:RimJ/RimL family protein N-acetyltransferase
MDRIETRRFILRRFKAADWRSFQELGVDWQAAPGPAFDKWPTTEEASKSSVEYMSTSDKYYAMCERGSGKVVGLLGLNGIDEEKRLDLGHVVLSRYQDDDQDREVIAALVRHCFDTKDVRAVITHNAPDHAAQLDPLKSLGFTNENPQEAGEWTITREEWEERR